MLRLWPDPKPDPLSDDDLVSLYTPDERTWLRVNFVTSLDGAATLEGLSKGMSSPGDRRVFRLLRMLCDALVVGAGTVRIEGYSALRLSPERRAWRRDRGLPEFPVLVVASDRLDLRPTHPVFADAPVRPIVVTGAASPPQAREALAEVADVLVHGERELDLHGALAELRSRGLRQVLSEGGPRLFGSMVAADLVDELCLTMSPLLTGPGAGRITAGTATTPEPRQLTLRHILAADGQLLLRYTRHSTT